MSDTKQIEVTDLTTGTFDEYIGKAGLTVVDFWAPWCGPCVQMAPQFKKAAGMRPDYNFAKVNVDEEPELSSRYEISSIPTLAVMMDGELVGTAAGAVRAKELVDALDKVADSVADSAGSD